MSFEEEFDIRIPDGKAATLETPRLAGDFIEAQLIQAGKPIPRSVIDEKIKLRTIEISGISFDTYAVDKEFVRDFGMD